MLYKCKCLYKHYKITFIPFLFWAPLSERNAVKSFNKLKLFKSIENPLLTASTYFLYKFVHKKDVRFEFIYGKTFGYFIHKAPLTQQSFEFTAFIERTLHAYPHLHLPQIRFESKIAQRKYYKVLASFYIGLFSWFNVHFMAHAFRQIFSPPVKIETLDEKACINLFVKEVVMRVLKGLTWGLDNVIKFYEIWDEH